jgi:hypothetical protein
MAGNGLVASGSVAIGSCTFLTITSTFPAGQGLQVGDSLVLDPCLIDAIDRRLIVTNASVSSTPTISSPPVVIPPNTTLNLPHPPPLIIDENTAGALQIVASMSGPRQGTTTLSITVPPIHGTATLSTTGVVIYQPVANFHGSDRLMVTVVVSFADNVLPALLLGTVTNAVTVRTLFGTDAHAGNLFTMDPATGIGTIVGPMDIGAVPVLALDPSTGTMYAATGGGSADLYRFDPGTGAATLIGPTGLSDGDSLAAVGAMAFRADGTLYAAVNIVGNGGTGSDNLATIDTATGQATLIGPFDGVCVCNCRVTLKV